MKRSSRLRSPIAGALAILVIGCGSDHLGSDSPSQNGFPNHSNPGSSTTTQTVSVSTAGAVGDKNGSGPAISSNGRFVAFSSQTDNLVPNSGSFAIFLRDTCFGINKCTQATNLVAASANGLIVDSDSAISPDGRFIAYSAHITTGPPEADFSNVYLRDTCLGTTNCTPSTLFVRGNPGAGLVLFSGFSTTGRFIVYNYAPPSGLRLTYVYDTCIGATNCSANEKLVSEGNDGTSANGPSGAFGTTSVTPDGRFILFSSSATNLDPTANNGASFVYRRDTCAGLSSCAESTTLVSKDSQGALIPGVQSFSISSDGRLVAFAAPSGVFVRDTCQGAVLCSPSTLFYKCSDFYDPADECGIIWNDREITIL
jgi:hypothetical protein